MDKSEKETNSIATEGVYPSYFERLKMRIQAWYERNFGKNNYEKHLEREVAILRKNLKEGDSLVIEDYMPALRQIAKVASKQGHSGGSIGFYAGAVSSAVKNMLLFKPMGPITADLSEWGDVSSHMGRGVKQNKRFSACFWDEKEKHPHFIDAIVFQGEQEFDTFTGTVEDVSSRQYFKLPCRPKTFYIDVVRERFDPKKHDTEKDRVVTCGDGDYVYTIKDRAQLLEVAKFYTDCTFRVPEDASLK
jgi:hypothetical protein